MFLFLGKEVKYVRTLKATREIDVIHKYLRVQNHMQ